MCHTSCQCFGFLGPNGAGKSTTIAMLCGDSLPTSGTPSPTFPTNTNRFPLNSLSGAATVCGHNVAIDPLKAWQCSGFCPQFDALYDDLTVQV